MARIKKQKKLNAVLRSADAESMHLIDEFEPEPKKPAANNCLNCRWKQAVEKSGKCPATGKKIKLENPVKNCDRFREFKGSYY